MRVCFVSRYVHECMCPTCTSLSIPLSTSRCSLPLTPGIYFCFLAHVPLPSRLSLSLTHTPPPPPLPSPCPSLSRPPLSLSCSPSAPTCCPSCGPPLTTPLSRRASSPHPLPPSHPAPLTPPLSHSAALRRPRSAAPAAGRPWRLLSADAPPLPTSSPHPPSHPAPSDPQLLSVGPDLLPQLRAALDDSSQPTRLLSCRCVRRVLVSAGSALCRDQLHAMYPDLLKRLDDSSDDVRIAVAATFAAYVDCLAGGGRYDVALYRAHLEEMHGGLLVHLDDPEPAIQEAVLGQSLPTLPHPASPHPEGFTKDTEVIQATSFFIVFIYM